MEGLRADPGLAAAGTTVNCGRGGYGFSVANRWHRLCRKSKREDLEGGATPATSLLLLEQVVDVLRAEGVGEVRVSAQVAVDRGDGRGYVHAGIFEITDGSLGGGHRAQHVPEPVDVTARLCGPDGPVVQLRGGERLQILAIDHRFGVSPLRTARSV